MIGSDYFLLEDYAAADKWLTRSVELDPGDPMAQYYLGRAKYNEKRFEDAVRALHRMPEAGCRERQGGGLSGPLLRRVWAKPKKLWPLTVRRSPRRRRLRRFRAVLRSGPLLVENTGARRCRAIPSAGGPDGARPTARAHRELGKAYLELNRIEQAQAELEKAVALLPENAPLHFLLAQACESAVCGTGARRNRALYRADGAHSSPDTPLAEARSLLESGKLTEAEQSDSPVSGGPQELRRWRIICSAYILFKKQDPKASLAEYTEAAKYRTPRSAADLEAVAGDYVLLKDYPDADKWFTKAVRVESRRLAGLVLSGPHQVQREPV